MGARPVVYVRDLGYRWGSLGKNDRVNFHWATIQLSPPLIDYVIVHELAHVNEPNHTPDFWLRVERAMPGYQAMKKELASVGSRTLARWAERQRSTSACGGIIVIERPVVDVDRIDGKPRTVRELFTSRKYSVDYYQREFAWTQANVIEFSTTSPVASSIRGTKSHEREDTLSYRPYFLGPIVTNNRGGTLFFVDGQQRLTTLTLLLIYLLHLQEDRPPQEQVDVRQFVASTRVGKWSFNLDVEDRRECMQALLEGVPPVVPEGDESVENLWARYQDVEQLFPQELKDRKLPFFIDWLLERVAVVEIATSDQEMALEIFETMNDRGLRLTTTDMLKSYLLAMIRDPEKIESANRLWRGRVAALSNLVDKGDSDFIRNWLRSKYAETIRDRRKDAVPGDFDIIGRHHTSGCATTEMTLGSERRVTMRHSSSAISTACQSIPSALEASQKMKPVSRRSSTTPGTDLRSNTP